MASFLFSKIFSDEILVDFDSLVEQAQAGEESEGRKAQSEERGLEVHNQPNCDDGGHHDENVEVGVRTEAAILFPKPVTNRLSVLTTGQGALIMSSEGRPLAEPPIFNYDWFVREAVPSDDKLKVMFPTDPVQRTSYRDMLTERALLDMFDEWADDRRKEGSDTRDRKREKFYEDLVEEIKNDAMPVDEEYYHSRLNTTSLIRWEQDFLDNNASNGPTASLRQRLKLGEDPFTIYAGGEEARAKYGYLLKDLSILPQLPSHNLESWEFYQLGGDTQCTTRVERMIWKGFNDRKLYLQRRAEDYPTLKGENVLFRNDSEPPTIFTKAYFGGEAARVKWDHLTDLAMWECRLLDNDGGTKLLLQYLHDGRADVFTGIGGDLARAKYASIIPESSKSAKHDLATWKAFQLDADGVGTTKIRGKIKQISGSANNESLFTPMYYGGMEARAEFGYLVWEADYLDKNGGTKRVQARLERGEDVFQDWIGESALARYGYLLEKLPRPPKHDLATWEHYFIDSDGGHKNIMKWLANGQPLFEPKVYGGIQARPKYGWVYWACENLSHKGYKSACQTETLNPADIQQLRKRLEAGEDIFHSWYGRSAKEKFGGILEGLKRVPRHDVETWERFQMPDGSPENVQAKLEAGRDRDIFDPHYYGGVEAREKWGHLAPKYVRDNWDSPLDVATRRNMSAEMDTMKTPWRRWRGRF